jgi:hypothetical protein
MRMFQFKRKLVENSGLRGYIEYRERWTLAFLFNVELLRLARPSYTILFFVVFYRLYPVPIYPGEGT